MAVSEIIKKVDELDQLIRSRLKVSGISATERSALEALRISMQAALTDLFEFDK